MRPVNERLHYNITSSLIGWVQGQKYPWRDITAIYLQSHQSNSNGTKNLTASLIYLKRCKTLINMAIVTPTMFYLILTSLLNMLQVSFGPIRTNLGTPGKYLFVSYDLYSSTASHFQPWFHRMDPWFGSLITQSAVHDDIIKWKHFLCYWPFVRGIHQSPMNSPIFISLGWDFRWVAISIMEWADTCTENVLKTRFQDVQNVNSEDFHKI